MTLKNKNKIIGIYCVENLINHKRYIGQSANITRRFVNVKSSLRINRFHNSYLQNDFNNLGEENFTIYLLKECEINLLDVMERFYIDLYKTMDNEFGYNLLSGGKKGFVTGKDVVERISKSLIGNQYRTGIPHSEDIRNKISKSEQGIKIGGTSKYVGVGWHKGNGKWRTRIEKNGKQKYLGYYDNEEDAAEAYNRAALEYYGNDARLNIIERNY